MSFMIVSVSLERFSNKALSHTHTEHSLLITFCCFFKRKTDKPDEQHKVVNHNTMNKS